MMHPLQCWRGDDVSVHYEYMNLEAPCWPYRVNGLHRKPVACSISRHSFCVGGAPVSPPQSLNQSGVAQANGPKMGLCNIY